MEYISVVNIKHTLLFVAMLCVFEFVQASDLTKDGGNKRYFTDLPDSQSWTIANNDAKARLYSDLIDILERMDVFQSQDKLAPCLKLEKIVREVNSSSTQATIGIHLLFKETPFQHSQRNAQIGYKVSKTDDVTYITTSGCGHGSRLNAVGLDALDRKQANSSDKSISDKNLTEVVVAPQSTGDTKSHNGLSRTQVVVIATCSAVIGTFFLIAGIMRLTSFYKRYRTNREQALNMARRASSMGLNGSNMSSGNLRRDSSTSKASRQSNTALEGGGDLQVNRHDTAPTLFSTHNSSPTHTSDHKPLLPVKSLSHNSEEGSSHGSLAFIDEESHSRIKGDDPATDSELESEDDPLLRKSPDSGSSVEVPVPMIYQNANEIMTSRRNTVTYQDPDDQASKSLLEDLQKAVSRHYSIAEDDLTTVDECELENNKGDRKGSTNGRNDSSNGENMDLGSDVDITSENENKSNSCESDGSRSVESECDGKLVSDTNGNLDNDRSIGEMYAVTTGLTQSDGSLSDNRNYFYGNQSEYALDNYYDCYTYNGYSNPYRNNWINYYRSVDNDAGIRTGSDLRITNDVMNGQCLNIDDQSNQTGSTGVSPSELSVRSLSISKDSSGEPLLSASHNSSPPSSGGGYVPTGADNLALVDSGEDDVETGSTPCTVVPHIVPLAVYHKISPGFSQSMDQS